MGREFISSWLAAGDLVTLATDGLSLFAYRGRYIDDVTEQLAVESTLARLSTARLRELAPNGYGPAPKREVTRNEFIRSPAVVELVLRRAAGKCEYPDCNNTLFSLDSGAAYLEVHHIRFLREGGPDRVDNAAALCPSCHRAHHYASDRIARTELLSQAIHAKVGT